MRVVADEHGNAEEVNDYYAFGGLMSTSSRQSVQPYKYNGKELETACGVNWYDYGARRYDPVLGRWNGVDPLCEDYYSENPYGYCGNNPIRYIDPDGEFFWIPLAIGAVLGAWSGGTLVNDGQLILSNGIGNRENLEIHGRRRGYWRIVGLWSRRYHQYFFDDAEFKENDSWFFLQFHRDGGYVRWTNVP